MQQRQPKNAIFLVDRLKRHGCKQNLHHQKLSRTVTYFFLILFIEFLNKINVIFSWEFLQVERFSCTKNRFKVASLH